MTRRCQFGDQMWEIRVQLIGKASEAIAYQVFETINDENAVVSIDACEDAEAALNAMIRKLENKVGPLAGPCR